MRNISEKVILTPYIKDIISEIEDFHKIIYTKDFKILNDIRTNIVNKDKLICIKVDTETPLSEIEFNKDWESIPLALFVPNIGDLTKVLIVANTLRKFNIQIFVPADKAENIRDLRILSSVGINCGFYLPNDEAKINWDSIDDLFYYYAYTNTNKGKIEPFRYLLEKDYKDKDFNFDYALFNDKESFIYLDESKKFAVNKKSLETKEYLGEGIDSLKEYIKNTPPDFSKKSTMFIENNECSNCSAWGVCKSNYLTQCKADKDYKVLFDDVITFLNDKNSEAPVEEQAKKWQL